MAETKQQLHIAMFPWLAFGHIIPSLELGKLIARRKGHRISFISTPRNIDRLPKIPPDVAPLITFVKLPLPHVDNLPENAEATMDLPHHIIPYLKIAHDGLQEPLSKFLETSNPDWIVHRLCPLLVTTNCFQTWHLTSFLQHLQRIILVFHWTTKVVVVVAGTTDEPDPGKRTELEHFIVPPKWIPFPSKIVYRRMRAKSSLKTLKRMPPVFQTCFVSRWCT
ncbi:hypothetical protein I3843_08G135200 [Carya illinoinensis]|nr:hypothetical protein I3843_08G135200 [Carya illinoinensis]